MDLSENVAKKIVSGQPLIVEMVPISKTMVSLSHGEKNLLDS
jgi:hypothetical protein